MSVVMITSKAKEEHVAEVEAAIDRLFAALDREQPENLRYASCRQPDGVQFVVLLELEDGAENPLPALQEFLDFQEGAKTWLEQPPTPTPLDVLGSYRLFGGGEPAR